MLNLLLSVYELMQFLAVLPEGGAIYKVNLFVFPQISSHLRGGGITVPKMTEGTGNGEYVV